MYPGRPLKCLWLSDVKLSYLSIRSSIHTPIHLSIHPFWVNIKMQCSNWSCHLRQKVSPYREYFLQNVAKQTDRRQRLRSECWHITSKAHHGIFWHRFNSEIYKKNYKKSLLIWKPNKLNLRRRMKLLTEGWHKMWRQRCLMLSCFFAHLLSLRIFA